MSARVIITRKKQFVASLASYNVTIDGINCGIIKNGSNLQCSLNDGAHEITFKWMKKISTFSFCIPSDMGTVNMSMEFNKMTGNLILLSKDIKIDNCSYNFDHIVEQNPLHMQISPEEKLQRLIVNQQQNQINSTSYSNTKEPYEVKNLENFDNLDGLEFENWCATLLRNNGFINVEVTRASGDQGVDILAEKGEIKYAIQCKCYSSNLGNSPVQEVHAGKSMYNCHVGVVMTNRHFTSGAKELAKATGVLLWDREKLLQMMSNVEETISPYTWNDIDEKFLEAVELALNTGKISTTLLQRNLTIGFGRASKLIDEMEKLGIVGEPCGQSPRKVLMSKDDVIKMLNRTN